MADTSTASLGWRAAFAATLAMSMGIGPFAVNAISALSPMVVPELDLSRTELGSLATLSFMIAAGTSVLGGRQVDVFGGRTVLVAVFLTGGAAAVAMAGAQALPWLWLGAVLGGLSQAIANPVTNQLIADHIPSGRQGLQIGVKQSGVQMAQTVIGFVLPPLAVVVGWRSSILLAVVFAVVGLAMVWRVIPRARRGPTGRIRGPKPPLDQIVWWLAGYGLITGITVQAVLIYVPLYAFEELGVAAAIAGLATGVLGAAGMVARILWGRRAERIGAPIRTLSLLAGIAFLSVLVILTSQHTNPLLLWPGLVGFGSSAMAANAVLMLAVIRSAGAGRTGRASGIVGLGLYLGFMTGPVSFGALVDRTDSYSIGWGAVASLSLAALAATLVWQRRESRSAAGDTEEV